MQVCTGIDPASPAALPNFWIDGNKADVFPVGYTANGDVDWVQIVGPSSGSGSSATLTRSGSLDQPLPVQPQSLAAMLVRMELPDGDYFARLQTQLVSVRRQGTHIVEHEYFSRFLRPISPGNISEAGGLRTFITWRGDSSIIELTLVIENDLFNPGDTDGIWDENDEVAGDIHFKNIDLLLGASGYSIEAETFGIRAVERSGSENLRAGRLVGIPAGSKDDWNVLPGRVCIAKHMVLYPSGSADLAPVAREIANMKGYGYAANGPDDVHARRGFGANRDFVPEFNSNYGIPNMSPTGRAAALARSSEYYASLAGSIILGSRYLEAPFFYSGDEGYYFPMGSSLPYESGGGGIILRSGYHFTRHEWLASRLATEYSTLRAPYGLTDSTTGKQVIVDDLMQGSTYPWSLSHEYRSERYNPHFFNVIANQFNGLKPSSPLWGLGALPAGDTVVQSNTCQPFEEWNNWGVYPSSHLPRFHGQLHALVWGANSGYGKQQLEKLGAWVERTLPDAPIDYPTTLPFTNLGWDIAKRNFALVDTANVIVAAGREDDAGDPGGIAWQRGEGHLLHAYGDALRITAPGVRRDDMVDWAGEVAATLEVVLAPNGMGARVTRNPSNWGCDVCSCGPGAWTDGGTHPSLECIYGTFTPSNLGGIAGFEGEFPDAGSSDQAFMSSYLAYGWHALGVASGLTGASVKGVGLTYRFPLARWSRSAFGIPGRWIVVSDASVPFPGVSNPVYGYDFAVTPLPPEWRWPVLKSGGLTTIRGMHHLQTALRTDLANPTGPQNREEFLTYIWNLSKQPVIDDNNFPLQLPNDVPIDPATGLIDAAAVADRLQTIMSRDRLPGWSRTFGNHIAGVLGDVQHM